MLSYPDREVNGQHTNNIDNISNNPLIPRWTNQTVKRDVVLFSRNCAKRTPDEECWFSRESALHPGAAYSTCQRLRPSNTSGTNCCIDLYSKLTQSVHVPHWWTFLPAIIHLFPLEFFIATVFRWIANGATEFTFLWVGERHSRKHERSTAAGMHRRTKWKQITFSFKRASSSH